MATPEEIRALVERKVSEVAGDYDRRGELGISGDVAPGYPRMRNRVIVTTIQASAPA